MERLTTTSWRALTVLALALGFQLSFGQVVYVDQDATGTGDGASWTNAMTNLQAAIDAAATVASVSNPIQVWVKADTYFPTSTTTQTISFEIKNNVEMYGGFDGTEASLTQRDFRRNETILSGNIGSKSDSTDNSDRILLASSNITNSARVDGFTLSGAHINNTGGAIVMNGTAAELTVSNCTFNGNYASLGSAINAYFVTNANSKLNVYNSIFYHNGAIGSQSGAIGSKNALTLANCLFYGNKSFIGGAVAVQDGSLTMTNSTFAGNAVGGGGGSAVVTQNVSLLSMRNSIFWNNSGSSYHVSYGSIGTYVLSNNLINIDPLFVDYPNKDFSIGECSPAVNIGNNTAVVFSEDLAGNPRIYGTTVDAGAYENQFDPLSFSAVEKLDVSCFGGADGYISVNGAGGSGTVEYSIDGTNFSANSIFTGLAADTYTLTVRDVGNGCTYSEQHTLNEPSELGLTISSTNITCNGDDDGSISGTASGGTAPYRISFDGGTSFVGSQFTTDFTITNLTEGIYEVSVVDLNGCTFTVQTNVEIVEPLAITASPTVTDVACFGEATGSFTANASGGSAPLYYTIEGLSSNYLTSPTFENLAAGSYTLTVIDSKLCYEEYQLVIGEPTELTLAVTNATDPTCDGQSDGSITVAASGGTPSYFYSLDGENFNPSGTISNLSAGTYTILVEDENGCRAEVTEVIENQINLSLNTLATTHVSCNGEADGAFEVSLSGGTAVRYWIPNVAPQTSGVFSGLQAGSYEVTGQDTEGCTTTMTVEIQEPDELEVIVTQSGAGFTLTASGGTSPYEYSLDGTTFQSSPSFENLDGGLYTFTVLDAKGCAVESADFNLVLSSIENQLSIYPNPVRDVLKVEGVEFDRLTIYDLAGNRMISTKDHEVSFSSLKGGLYLVTLQDKMGQEIVTKKILKN